MMKKLWAGSREEKLLSLKMRISILMFSILTSNLTIGMEMEEHITEANCADTERIPSLSLNQDIVFEEESHEREALVNEIIGITQAEYDWPYHVKSALSKFLILYPETPLKEKVEYLIHQIKEPEDLLLLGPSELHIFYEKPITSEHKVFRIFRNLFIQIDEIIPELDAHLQEDMKKLKSFYAAFITSLCTAEASHKSSLLSRKVLLREEASLGFYRITQEIARQLISRDEYGFVQKENESGLRPVCSLKGVHFKVLSNSLREVRPGLEYAAYAFAKALTPQQLIAPSILLKLEGISMLENIPRELSLAKAQGKNLDEALAGLQLTNEGWQRSLRFQNHSFLVQASQTVGQRDLQETLMETLEFQADPISLSWQFLFSLLTSPGDGKPDHYRLEGENSTVIGIDNESLFHRPLYLYKERHNRRIYTGIQCILYLLDALMDRSLHPEARQAFLSLEPSVVVLKWLTNIYQQNQRYQRLIDQGNFTPQDLTNLGLPIQLAKGLAEEVTIHMVQLQTILRAYPETSVHHLLSSLHPTVASYYQGMRLHYQNDPLTAMFTIYKGFDANGHPQSVGDVLGLTPHDEVWQQAEEGRHREFTEDLVKCIKSFIYHLSPSHLDSSLGKILCLILTPFKGIEEELLGRLPREAWQRIVQAELDKDNSPLYRYINNNPRTSHFWQAFPSLRKRHAKISWAVTLDELFPLTNSSSFEKDFIIGINGERRLLTEEVKNQLEDPRHLIAQRPRKVIRIESNNHIVFIKFYPELPGYEEAVGELTRRVIEFGAPYGGLFRFSDGVPAWISQAIPGDPLYWVLEKDPERLRKLDPIAISKMILMAMLVNPEDGKPDNYIVEPHPDKPGLYRLSCPDNDHAFVPSFAKAKINRSATPDKTVAQVKTILYCLDNMNEPIPEETRNLFIKEDPFTLLHNWLYALRRYNSHYQCLYPDPQEVYQLFQKKGVILGIPFQKGTIRHLYNKWMRLKDLLQESAIENSFLTPLELLSKLEPRLAALYHNAFDQNTTILKRFAWIMGYPYRQEADFKTIPISALLTLKPEDIPFQASILGSKGLSLATQELLTLASGA
ncbi:MAG: hypothetical protein K0M45_00810 [Candidatus Paracaedibacteraceae bacterium]|nr:hypothetical protein [Candidatus Paracaedibacteraceae bacterium]